MAADSPLGPAPITIASEAAAIALLYRCCGHVARACELLALPLALRAKPGGDLPRRLCRHAQPIPAAGRRARPDAGGRVPPRGAVPLFAEPVSLGGIGSRLPCCRLGRDCALGDRAVRNRVALWP